MCQAQHEHSAFTTATEAPWPQHSRRCGRKSWGRSVSCLPRTFRFDAGTTTPLLSHSWLGCQPELLLPVVGAAPSPPHPPSPSSDSPRNPALMSSPAREFSIRTASAVRRKESHITQTAVPQTLYCSFEYEFPLSHFLSFLMSFQMRFK